MGRRWCCVPGGMRDARVRFGLVVLLGAGCNDVVPATSGDSSDGGGSSSGEGATSESSSSESSSSEGSAESGALLDCGNLFIDAGEACDGDELAGLDCTDFGFQGGSLACLSDCSDFDASACGMFGGDCCSEHPG